MRRAWPPTSDPRAVCHVSGLSASKDSAQNELHVQLSWTMLHLLTSSDKNRINTHTHTHTHTYLSIYLSAHIQRERERHTHTHTHTQTDRQTESERERDRDREVNTRTSGSKSSVNERPSAVELHHTEPGDTARTTRDGTATGENIGVRCMCVCV